MLELVIQSSPTVVVLLCGPDFVIEMVNPACQAMLPGEEMVGRTVAEVWPEAAPLLIPHLQAARQGGGAYYAAGQAVPLHRGSGSPGDERYFDLSYVPLAQAGDVRVLMAADEVTAHKRVETKLQAAYAELAAIHDNAPVALFVIDGQFRVEKANDLAARFAGKAVADIVGLRPGEALGCLSALADPVGCGDGPACAKCAIRSAVMDSLINGVRHQGIEAWLSRSLDGGGNDACLLVSTSPMEFRQTRKVLVCAQDITEQKRTQLALESALAEKTILLKEIHHRVKNNLAVVSSLLSMKADAVTNPTAKEALLQSQQRVYSMALIHEHLYGNERLDRINFAEYATQLVRRLHAALAGEPDRIAIELALDPIELGIEQAVPCGLILNELLTNAFKYAFRGRESGRIAVSFRERAGMHELSVADDGVGIPAEAAYGPNGDSLGLRIVEVLTHQLDGTLQHEPHSGTRVVLRFPAGRVTR
jgi:two-component sensor histidine kinase/PAS domain-containing protein